MQTELAGTIMCVKDNMRNKNAKYRILLGMLGSFVVEYIRLKAIVRERKNKG